jgi:threonine dehydratase
MRTPVRRSDWLSSAAGADVYLKLETLQPTFSYKIRGAWNAVLMLLERGVASNLVTASAGNHGRALAAAARDARLELRVYVPATAPRVKVSAIRATGAEIRMAEDYDDAERQAQADARRSGACYISPYSHPDVIAGAGTIGLELLENIPDIDTIVVPVGGGGLISGIAIATEGTTVVGVEAQASSPFTQSLAAGRIVPISVGPTLADGLAGNLDPGSITFEIVKSRVHGISVVSEDEIRSAIRGMLNEERLVVEGAAATAVAAVLSGGLKGRAPRAQRVAVVLSGANIDPETLRAII